ncbi:MAG: cytochrome P450 [Candidatus Hydrogenedentota bacterium]
MAAPRVRERHFPIGARVDLGGLAASPYGILAELREHEPVSWVPSLNMWFVTRRDDVIDVLKDTDTFTTDSPDSTIRDTFGPQMLSADGETQQRFRAPCNPMFRPAAVLETFGPEIETRAHALIEGLDARGEAELRTEFAGRLAVQVVALALGLPAEDELRIRAWYNDFAAALANFEWRSDVREQGRRSAREFCEYASTLAGIVPNGSLLRAMASANSGLSEDEALGNALIVLFGGIETTESMISNALWALLTHPEQLQQIRNDLTLLDNAVEETLRWEPAVQTCTRHATRSTAIRGVPVAEGDTVQCMIGAVNRDPDHFESPEVFDILRTNARDHFAFGYGKHFCLGAHLARLETRVALKKMMEKWPSMRLDVARSTAPYGYEFRKPNGLWVEW